MEIVPVIGTVAIGLCLLLLIFVSVQLNGLRNKVADLEDELRRERPARGRSVALDPDSATLANLLELVQRVDAAVDGLRTQGGREASLAPTDNSRPVNRSFSPADAPEPQPSRRFVSAVDPVPAPVETRQRDSIPAPRADVFPVSNVSPRLSGDHRDKLLEEYRELIAQPRKADINRWIDERGGESVEAAEDGAFQPLGRDSGGLLVLLPLDDQRALVLPGGRLVVDFATSFANVISMRSVTRQAFDLTNDGSGVLQLVEPAFAERRDGVWRLARPGRLAGLKPD
ncbi:MAG: hypothetical protein ABIS51_23255 [Sphingomonas sp.]